MSALLAILGKTPDLSIAELSARFPTARITRIAPQACRVEGVSAFDLSEVGGVVKYGRVLVGVAPAEALLREVPEGKLLFGVSVYGGENLKTILIGLKKELAAQGRNPRFANKDFQNLSSAQVKLQGLLGKGRELLYAGGVVAITEAVQPFDEYRARDYEKQGRDAKIGMLPPKLAQMMVNIACGAKRMTVYDPFCGTGTVLTEALLLGHAAVGSDYNGRMVEYAKKNTVPFGEAEVFLHDARRRAEVRAEVVVTEGFLGPALSQKPTVAQAEQYAAELAELYSDFFSWIARPVVITLPVWQGVLKSSERILPRLGGWEAVGGYLYARPDQVVGREVWRLMPR